MAKYLLPIGLAMVLVAATIVPAYADSINQFTFQGIIRDVHGAPVNGLFGIVTRLYNNLEAPAITYPGNPVGQSDPNCTPANNCLYSQNQTVAVFNGVFTVFLGNKTALRPINFTTPLYLEVVVKNNTVSYGDPNFNRIEVLSPRLNVTAAPFAIASQSASGVLSPNHQFSWFDLNGKRVVNATDMNFTTSLLRFNSDSKGHVASISNTGVINGSSITAGGGTFTGTTDVQSSATFKTPNVIIIRNPTSTQAYSLTGGAITSNRTLNIPVTTATDTLAVLGIAQTFTAAQTLNSNTDIENASPLKVANTGLQVRTTTAGVYATIAGGATASNQTFTLPTITAGNTIAVLGIAQTFTAAQTLNSNTDIENASPLKVANTGLKITSAASGIYATIAGGATASNQTFTLPTITAGNTIAVLGTAQTFTGIQTFGAHVQTSGTVPTNTDVGSTDFAGKVSITAAQQNVNATFASAFTNAPSCVVSNTNATGFASASATTTTLTVRANNVATTISYICVGR